MIYARFLLIMSILRIISEQIFCFSLGVTSKQNILRRYAHTQRPRWSTWSPTRLALCFQTVILSIAEPPGKSEFKEFLLLMKTLFSFFYEFEICNLGSFRPGSPLDLKLGIWSRIWQFSGILSNLS